jgi:hypothetical protein
LFATQREKRQRERDRKRDRKRGIAIVAVSGDRGREGVGAK